jgi:hypothetical protein
LEPLCGRFKNGCPYTTDCEKVCIGHVEIAQWMKERYRRRKERYMWSQK